MPSPRWLLLTTLSIPLGLLACGSPGDTAPQDPTLIDNGFVSDDPDPNSASDAVDAANGAPSSATGAAAPAEKSDDAARAVAEADIIKLAGDRLYALSRFGGLSIVDVSDPDHMRFLGRKRTDGMPFEMYVLGGRAYVMMNDFGRYVRAEGNPYGSWVQTSEIVALDVTNAADIKELGQFDVPGSISDSRVVGDALYLVTNENGYCWGCQKDQATLVTSFNLAGGSIAKVDQIVYAAPSKSYAWWKRSVSATNQRLYIGGPSWAWTSGTPQSSVIQVVDISDPAGHMAKGADVPIAGQINSRWQMDEFGGVLRVVSQPWSTSVNPKVETFRVNASSSITPLGKTDLVLPKPESLRSVRFDGLRGYAITAERTDPLYTIDLSNPAAPRQAAELTMPGWIFHMEPRGDRLVGFGYEGTTWSSRLAVSLFDVADLAKPKLLERVPFGSASGHVAEDQDRIHKSVQVLDALGLVLVPFASYGTWSGTGCSKPESGIQLIDMSRDHLTLRGLAPQRGMPRRAILAKDRLLAMSDRNVTGFDITSRDAPKKTNEIDLSNPIYRMTELPKHIASITNDWWTGEAVLSLTDKSNVDDAAMSGKISLAELAEPSAARCSGASGWTSWYEARLFPGSKGDVVYVVVPTYTYSATSTGGHLVVAAVDVKDPMAPAIVGKTRVALTERDRSNGRYYGWHPFWDGYAFYSWLGGTSGVLVGAGEGVVQIGDKIAYLEVDREVTGTELLPGGGRRSRLATHRKLHVVDLAAPASPLVHPPVDLGDSVGVTPLHVAGSTVLTSRWLRLSEGSPKVRFYADRVDLSGPAPNKLPSINTPGSLVQVDVPSNRFVTADYVAARTTAPSWGSCTNNQRQPVVYDQASRECVRFSRSLKLADVKGDKVTLRQTFALPAENIAGVRVAEDRVYLSRYARYDHAAGVVSPNGTYKMPPLLDPGGLWAIGGIRAGELSIVSSMSGDSRWPLAARGTKVALYTDGGLAIYDTAAATPTLVRSVDLRGWGYTSHVLMGEDRAICSLGEWGMQSVKY